MAIVTTDSKHYEDIAKKIRRYLGGSAKYTPAEMADGIDLACSKWGSDAYASGLDDGRMQGREAERIERDAMDAKYLSDINDKIDSYGVDRAETLSDVPDAVVAVYEAGASSGNVPVDESKIITKTVTGNPVKLKDVSEIRHKVKIQGNDGVITVRGNNIYKPTLITDTINGVTAVKNDDDSYTLNGTASADCGFILGRVNLEPNTYYGSGGINDNIRITFQLYNGTSGIDVLRNAGGVTVIPKTYNNTLVDNINVIIYVVADTVLNDVVVKPMIGRVNDLAYEPYYNKSYLIQNGTVDIDSLSPYMEISANSDISVTYHKSYGAQLEYDRFWDNFQNGGGEVNYRFAFAYNKFSDDNYNPKYDIMCESGASTSAVSVFQNSANLTDTKVPIHANGTAATSMFQNCSALKTINKLVVHEALTYSGAFSGCTALENIVIEGVIGKTLGFNNSTKLSRASIESIIAALSKTATGVSVTFSKTAVNNAFTTTEWENYLATNKPSGWTVSLV